MRQDLACYAYVSRPIDAVRAAITRDVLAFIGPAADAASDRAHVLADALRVSFGGVEIGKKIRVEVTSFQPDTPVAGRGTHGMEVELVWKAAAQEALFPVMEAKLYVYPLSTCETQLELEGRYEPPAGAIGALADRLVGHRIAQAAVHRFLDEMRDRLTAEIPG